MEKTNTTALGLHLVPGSADGVLTYADGIADIEYQHINPEEPKGATQADINKELTEAITSEMDWYEE